MFKPIFIVTKRDFFLGISFGLIFAYILYNLFHIFRNIFRICNLVEFSFFLELTKEEAFFFNFLFAFIALTISKSLVFTFWIRRQPVKNIKNIYIRKRTIHEQWAFLNYFLHWFFKLVIFTSFLGVEVLYILETYTNFFYSYILLLLVLYLSSWQTFLLKYKKSQLIMLKSFVVVTLFAFIFPFINLIKEDRIDRVLNYNNTLKIKNIQLPKSSYAEFSNKYINSYIYNKDSCLLKYDDNVTSTFCINNIKNSNFSEMNDYLSFHRYRKKRIEYSSMSNNIISDFNFNADQNIKIKEINTFKVLMLYYGHTEINLMVHLKNKFFDKKNYRQCIIPLDLTCIRDKPKENKEKISIHIQKNMIKVNEKVMSLMNFKEEYYIISKSNPVIFKEISFDNNTSYQQYINVLSHIYSQHLQHIDKYAIKKYNKDFTALNLEKRNEINSLFPINYREIIPYSQVKEIFECLIREKPIPLQPPTPNYNYLEPLYNEK